MSGELIAGIVGACFSFAGSLAAISFWAGRLDARQDASDQRHEATEKRVERIEGLILKEDLK